MRDKPMIDRQKHLDQEERQRRVLSTAREAVRLLRPGEELGPAVRSGDRISFPVQTDGGATRRRGERPQRDEELSSVYTALFETGVL